MMKSCSKCGKIHQANYKCHKDARVKISTDESKLRSTYKWTQKSLEIREKANFLCQVCRDNGQFTYDGLEIHHIETLKDRPDLLLDDSNLVCLCVEHHKQADAGELDKDYLLKLAEDRERKNIPEG